MNDLLDLQKMTKHERRALKKEEKEKEMQQIKRRIKYKKIALFAFIAILTGGSVVSLIVWAKQIAPEISYTREPVHWHGHLSMNVCGQKVSLPKDGPSAFTHGKDAIGTSVLHHHFDDTIHIEGRVIKKEDISLKHFFEVIKVPFGPDRFMDKVDGDCHDGNPDKTTVTVENENLTYEVIDLDQYIVADGDQINIRFE